MPATELDAVPSGAQGRLGWNQSTREGKGHHPGTLGWLSGAFGPVTGGSFLSLGSAHPTWRMVLSGCSPRCFLGILRVELLRALVPVRERGVGGD